MLVQLLVYYNYVHERTVHYTFVAKQILRRWLGPEIPNFYVLENGDTVPTTAEIPTDVLETAYFYDVESQRLTKTGTTEGRYRPVPLLGLVVRNPAIGMIDLTDWVGNIRMNPVAPISAKTLVGLWSAINNRYIPTQGTLLEVTDSNGDTSTV